jgi:hypothetical protein
MSRIALKCVGEHEIKYSGKLMKRTAVKCAGDQEIKLVEGNQTNCSQMRWGTRN